MKTWWLETGWPWLKENWWVLLILPLVALVWVARRMQQRPVLIDPTNAADERAYLEAKTRARQLEVENKRLENRVADLHEEMRRREAELRAEILSDVDRLRQDPDELLAYMKRHGPGR